MMVIKYFENQIYHINLIKVWLYIILYFLPTVTVQFVQEERSLKALKSSIALLYNQQTDQDDQYGRPAKTNEPAQTVKQGVWRKQ